MPDLKTLADFAEMEIPYIDDSVRYTGVSSLRSLNAACLRKLSGMIVIQDGGEPIAVLMGYDNFIDMQKAVLNAQA